MKTFFCTISVCLTLCSNAQIILDSALTKSYEDCISVRYNAINFLSRYLYENKIDSARMVFDFWQSECGMDNSMIYSGALLDLLEGKHIVVNDSLIFIDAILDNRFDDPQYRSNYYYNYPYTANNPYSSYYLEHCINSKAKQKLTELSTNNFDYLICLMLAGFRIDALQLIKSSEYSKSLVQNRFYERRRNLLKNPSFHMQFRSGVWKPIGNASILGLNPTMGCTMGAVLKNGDIFDLAIEGRLGSVPTDTVFITFQDSVYQTDYISGFFFGMEYEKKLWHAANFRHRCGWRFGLGFESLSVLPESLRNKNEKNEDGDYVDVKTDKRIPSFALHTGLTYDYRLTNTCFAGIYLRYHYANFNNVGGTDITGNAISALVNISFHLGFDEEEMRRMGYIIL